MSTDKQQRHAIEVQGRIEKYEYALKAFVALEYKFCAFEKMDVRQGKKLYIPKAEPGGGERMVTPDMVIETASQRRLYRAVVEIKGSLPTRPEDWNGILSQLEKYKLASKGWSGSNGLNTPHDVILATGKLHAEKFADWLNKFDVKRDIKKWLVIVTVINPNDNDNGFIDITKVYGRIRHSKIDSKMSAQKCQIPMYKIIKKIDRMKFYDSDPPVEYTMAILWDHVFSKFIHGKKLQKMMDGEKVSISTNMDRIRKTIKAFAPRSNPECVRQSWIRKAMLWFEEIKVVSVETNGSFTITYKKHNMSTTKWITGRTKKLQNDGANTSSPKRSSDNMSIESFFGD